MLFYRSTGINSVEFSSFLHGDIVDRFVVGAVLAIYIVLVEDKAILVTAKSVGISIRVSFLLAQFATL